MSLLLSALEVFAEEAASIGLIINWKQTKVRSLSDFLLPLQGIIVNGDMVETVTPFTFLGATISFKCSTHPEITRRLGVASVSMKDLVIPTISSTFSSKTAIAKFRNARQTKMADVDCIRTFLSIHYPTGRRRLVRHQPPSPSYRRSRFGGRRSRPRSRPRRTLSPPAASLVIPTISSTFSSKSAIAKLRNARQTKMADVDSNIQHTQVTLKNHCT